MMTPEERAAHWRKYRATRNAVWIVLFGGPFVVMGVSMGLFALVRSSIPFYLLGFAWMGLFAYLGLKMIYVTCPQCEGRFHVAGGTYNPFSPDCAQCQHPKWE